MAAKVVGRPVKLVVRRDQMFGPLSHRGATRQTLRLGTPPTGLRTYLAVRGGVDVAPVLGSRTTDTLSGLGPPRLDAGQQLPVGPEPDALPVVDVAPVPAPPGATVTLRVVLGPRVEFLADPHELTGTLWTASSRSDRVGMRLEGGQLRRGDDSEIPSEGMVRGAVQVPAGGEPVVFLADHPVTGGYPVVATVCDVDVDRAAQVRPGQGVRFAVVRRATHPDRTLIRIQHRGRPAPRC